MADFILILPSLIIQSIFNEIVQLLKADFVYLQNTGFPVSLKQLLSYPAEFPVCFP